jgi:hypothetical protein
MNWDLPLHLEIPLILEPILQGMKFCKNHLSVLDTFDIPKNQDQFDLSCLYWIPKLHKNPYKDTLLVPVNALLSHYLYYSLISEMLFHCILQNGVNQMWPLKSSNELRKFKVP